MISVGLGQDENVYFILLAGCIERCSKLFHVWKIPAQALAFPYPPFLDRHGHQTIICLEWKDQDATDLVKNGRQQD